MVQRSTFYKRNCNFLFKHLPVTACDKHLCFLECDSKVMSCDKTEQFSAIKRCLTDTSKLSKHSSPMASKISGEMRVLVSSCRLLSVPSQDSDQKQELLLIKTLLGLTPLLVVHFWL